MTHLGNEVIETYFPEFLEFFFPEAYRDIDWGKGYDNIMSSKEIQEMRPHFLPQNGFPNARQSPGLL